MRKTTSQPYSHNYAVSRRWILALTIAATAASATTPRTAHSQSQAASCPAGSVNPDTGRPDTDRIGQDACYKAIDLFHFMAPQLGAIISGAGATQGTVGTLGGLGHFSLGFRANGLVGDLPEVDKVTPATDGAVASNYTIKPMPLGLPVADVALGLFKGLGLGPVRVGGVDALGSLAFMPKYNGESITVSQKDGQWQTGLGARVGIIEGSPIWPAVSVTYIARGLPTTTVIGASGDDSLKLEDVSVRTKSWRVVATKKLAFLGLAAGTGKDSYDSNAQISVYVAPRPTTEGVNKGPIALTQQMDRTNTFASLWITSTVLRIIGEAGITSGGEVATFNQFSGVNPAKKRTYFSVGISFGR